MSYRFLSLSLAIFGLLYFGAVQRGYRQQAAFTTADEFLRASPEAAAVLGGGLRIGLFPLGGMSEAEGETRLRLPVTGEAGRGTARMRLEVAGGRWRVVQAELVGGGETTALPAEDRGRLRRGRAAAARGYALFQSGRPDEALIEFRSAAAEDPGNPEAQYWLGYLLEATGDQEAALHAFLRAAELDPSDPPSHYAIGVVYGRLGRLEESRESLDRAIALDPADGRSHFSRAVTRSRMGDQAGARRDLGRACDLDFQDACAALRRQP